MVPAPSWKGRDEKMQQGEMRRGRDEMMKSRDGGKKRQDASLVALVRRDKCYMVGVGSCG